MLESVNKSSLSREHYFWKKLAVTRNLVFFRKPAFALLLTNPRVLYLDNSRAQSRMRVSVRNAKIKNYNNLRAEKAALKWNSPCKLIQNKKKRPFFWQAEKPLPLKKFLDEPNVFTEINERNVFGVKRGMSFRGFMLYTTRLYVSQEIFIQTLSS